MPVRRRVRRNACKPRPSARRPGVQTGHPGRSTSLSNIGRTDRASTCKRHARRVFLRAHSFPRMLDNGAPCPPRPTPQPVDLRHRGLLSVVRDVDTRHSGPCLRDTHSISSRDRESASRVLDCITRGTIAYLPHAMFEGEAAYLDVCITFGTG
jgi:hypothetical protein